MKYLLQFFVLFRLGLHASAQQKPVTCESRKLNRDGKGFDIYCTNHTSHNYIVDINPYYEMNVRVSGAREQTLLPGSSKVASIRPINEKDKFKFRYRYTYLPGCLKSNHYEDAFYLLPIKDGNWTDSNEIDFIGDYTGHNRPKNWYGLSFTLSKGDTIFASRKGKVVTVQNGYSTEANIYNKYSNHIIVQHEDCTYAKYDLLKEKETFVKEGEEVIPGQPLSIISNRNDEVNSKLHFQVYFYKPNPKRKDKNFTGQKYFYEYVNIDFFVNGKRNRLEQNQSYKAVHPHEIIMKEMGRRERKKYKKSIGL